MSEFVLAMMQLASVVALAVGWFWLLHAVLGEHPP